jgi:hypothetical protein
MVKGSHSVSTGAGGRGRGGEGRGSSVNIQSKKRAWDKTKHNLEYKLTESDFTLK